MNMFDCLNELITKANPIRARAMLNFFKTGPGDYGEGDIFLGLTVPQVRELAKEASALSFVELKSLLARPEHEARLLALIVLTNQFQKANPTQQTNIYNLYLQQAHRINNWDLVDVSCYKIIGAYLFERDRKILYKLARSKNLWERRIAIVSTFYFITYGQPDETLALAEILLCDQHDLIHKAVGWMLREVGKRCGEGFLLLFLNKHASKMPRTMLRYSIERLSQEQRQYYLAL